LATLYQAPTIAELGAILDDAVVVDGMEIHAIQPRGALPPFFCIPGVGSDVIVLQELADALGDARPFYGLQAHGLGGTPSEHPVTRVEDAAAGFVAAIRTVQPDGPYHIGGHCFGSMLAWEVARQLRAQRQAVAVLALIDPVVSNILPAEIIQRDRVRYSLLNFLRLPFGEKGHYLLRKVRNFRRFMMVRQRAGRSIGLARTMHTNYRIEAYPGDVTIFMADDSFLNIAPERDPRRYYERFAAHTRYISVSGDHDSMIQSPAVATLAPRLRACLAGSEGV
jgi:thioesterase domain-containing protein